MNVLALIPARGGSKGIPRKNLRMVAGRTLVEWSVRAAQESRLVSRMVVSSDDAEILAEAVRCGADALARPAALATDEASTDAAILHALEASRWPDLVVLLQPTCPVRRPGLVDDCIKRLLDAGADSLFTASELHFIWRRQLRTKHNGQRSQHAPWVQCNAEGRRIRRQDFTEGDSRWAEDGSVFVTRAKLLRETGARIGGRIELFPNEAPGVDIDTEADLAMAEALLGGQREAGGRAPTIQV